MSWPSDAETWASLVTLIALEIVLGIDNIVFIAILASRLPVSRRERARRVGLALALISRLALLFSIVWIIGLTRPLFELFDREISWRDIILIAGGLFLLYKGTAEIHHMLEPDERHVAEGAARITFAGVVTQIVILDAVFSLDSVLTAIGMANELWVMAAAVIIAVAIMLAASGPLSSFIERHPTVRMLALSFLLLIGMTLIADGAGFHVPKGYVYAAIIFSIGVELLNQLAVGRRKRREITGAGETGLRRSGRDS